jgi:hypothetical protein
MKKMRKLEQVEELPEFGGTVFRDDVLAVIRTFRIRDDHDSDDLGRFEISLEGHGERAVFDVAGEEEPVLQDFVDDAVHAFINCIRLRRSRSFAGSERARKC